MPVGVFTGLAIFVPYLGFGLGAALALLAGVLQFSSWYGVGAVLLIYGVGQVAESFFLTPRLVGERIGLHPIAVIFVLLAFGHLFGFVGVLLALSLGALSLVMLRNRKPSSSPGPGLVWVPSPRKAERYLAAPIAPDCMHREPRSCCPQRQTARPLSWAGAVPARGRVPAT